jgi:hypothetical protein
MMNIVPVVSVSTHMNRKPQPGLKTSGRPPAICVCRSRKNAMPSDCTKASAKVR